MGTAVEWIPVTENLPKLGLIVLVTTIGSLYNSIEELLSGVQTTWIGHWDGSRWFDSFGKKIVVTHWAEVPKSASREECSRVFDEANRGK